MPESASPPPRSPVGRSVVGRFAQAAALHNAAFRPAPVVLLRAIVDVVVGRDLAADDAGVTAVRERAADVPRGGGHREGTSLSRRAAQAVLSVVAVGACVGSLASPPAAPGPEVGAAESSAGGASVSALRTLWSRVETSRTDVARAVDVGPDSALATRLRRRAEALRRRPAVPPGLPVGAPVAGEVSSPFGPRRHPVTRRARHHQGTDFAVPLRTPVRATADGRVLSVGRRSGYGLTVELAHRDPSGLETTTLYAHLDAAGVTVGLPVRRGDVVGLSGGVGPAAGLSTGPHVHYEVRGRMSGRASSSEQAVDPSVLYDRVRSWNAETARQRRALRVEARALAVRAQSEDRRPEDRRSPHTARTTLAPD